eukprot:c22520_g1_i1 orf=600-3026(+)
MGILFPCHENMLEAGLESAVGFEGFEKRLEVEFFAPPVFIDSDGMGIRVLSRTDIDKLLSAAECTIVAELSNDYFDSYVLSESSLFVYPYKIVLKTCGTTKLLKTIPLLLEYASLLSLKVRRCKYTRGSFMFPKEQPFPHSSFSEEVNFLGKYFGDLGGKAYVMGDVLRMKNWHIYSAAAVEDAEVSITDPVYTLEMCMTQLDRSKASKFFKSTCKTAAEMSHTTGIADLLPGSNICDYAFDPCGYSMNGMQDSAAYTIHVTPEDGFSYASFESMGYNPHKVNLQTLVDKVIHCFKPASFSLSLHVSHNFKDGSGATGSWAMPICPSDYISDGISREQLPAGSVIYHTFKERVPDTLTCLSPRVSLFSKESLREEPKRATTKSLIATRMVNGHSIANVERILSFVDPVIIGPTVEDMDSFISKKILSSGQEDAFYVLNLGVLLHLWKTWKLAMPRVHPFYAVKCNDDGALLAVLAALGAGFDVASKSEIESVRRLGVSHDRIIFANPCKLPSHIATAVKYGVHLTTFDSKTELLKLEKCNPQAKLVLRIRVCDAAARCPLGVKYGAEMDECEPLLTAAQNFGLQVVGVSFHVGSGALDAAPFAIAIKQARRVFDMASTLGLVPLRLLDIGGGFVSEGGNGVTFSVVASVIKEALDEYFPPSMGVTIIAEPGRFFAEEPFTLATQIFGSRMRTKMGTEMAEYWVNDGIYGSMNCLFYDHATLTVRAIPLCSSMKERGDGGCKATIFGPTCDGLDLIMDNVSLPRLQCGDWLLFPRMGAYTKVAGSRFNGFDVKDISTFSVCSAAEHAVR